MQSTRLDIVELIEQNPITKLSDNYQSKFLQKIQENFTETQQQLFVASFYTYLNYNTKTDFVIDLEDIWKWLGFSRKDPAKVVLEKHFTINIDYKILNNKTSVEKAAPEKKIHTNLSDKSVSHQPLENLNLGGRPNEKILINISTFKKLCLKSNTKKADKPESHRFACEFTSFTNKARFYCAFKIKINYVKCLHN